MWNYNDFNALFDFDPSYTYNELVIQTIGRNNRALRTLFVHRILRLLGITKPATRYPPKSNGELRELHHDIVGGVGDDHIKLSLLYYIFLDCDDYTGRQMYSDRFEQISALPSRYQIFMKGIWYMDRMEFENALQYLTHPSLIPTFSEEILEVLVRHAHDEDFSLALAYYHSAQPRLQTSAAADCLFLAISRSSVTEAYAFAHEQSHITRRQVFEQLIGNVLKTQSSDVTAARALELVNLPFSAEETEWLEEFLTIGEGRKIPHSRDTLMMRRMATGSFSRIAFLGEPESKKIGGLSWEVIKNNVTESLGSRA